MPEQAKRAVDRHVALLADDHADRRRAGETVGFDVPADLREHVVARSGERGDVSHLAAGDEPDRDVGGKPSSSSTSARHLFDDGGAGPPAQRPAF